MLFPNAPDAPNCLVSLTPHWQITRPTTCLLLIQPSSTYYLQILHPNGKYLKIRLITQDIPKLIAESVRKAGCGLGTSEKAIEHSITLS